MSKSIDCMVSQLDVFSPPALQSSVIAGDWQQFKPVQSITDDGPLTFQIPGSGSAYIDLNKTLLYVRFRVIDQATNKPYTSATEYTVVNNTLHTLFQDVKLELGQTTISTSNGMYQYRSYFEDLFNYNQTAKSTHLTSSLFYQDESGGFDNIKSEGNAKRAFFVKESKEVEVCGRLHCDLLSTNKYLLNEIDVRITLTRNPASIIILGSAGMTPKIELRDATLLVRKVLPNAGILVAHSKILNTNCAKYMYKRVDMLNFTISAGIFQKSIESMFTNRLPTRVVIGLVKNSAFTGQIDQNCFNFENFKLNSIALTVNSNIVGSVPYRPNFSEDRCLLPYLLSFYHLGIGSGDDGFCVSREDYSKGFALFCWDLTPDMSASDQHWSVQPSGNCRLELSFAEALPCVCNIVCYAEYNELLEIDRNRSMHIQYKV